MWAKLKLAVYCWWIEYCPKHNFYKDLCYYPFGGARCSECEHDDRRAEKEKYEIGERKREERLNRLKEKANV